MPLSRYSRSLAVLLVGLAAGCGSGRYGASGNVSFDGKPIESGTITFFAEGSSAPAGGAPVINGNFNVPDMPGLLPGTYRVSISATVPDPRFAPAGGVAAPDPHLPLPPGLLMPPLRELLPTRYNSNTELQANVVRSTKKNVFPFDLTSTR